MSDVTECFERAWQLHQANRLEEAERLYCQVLQNNPRHADAWCFLGGLCQAQGRYQEAETYLRNVFAITPRHLSALNCLGVVVAQQQRWEEAAALLEQALQMDPGAGEVWANLASVRLHQGLLDQAEVCCSRALQIDPRRPEALGVLSRIADVWREQGDRDRAVAGYRQVLQFRPDAAQVQSNLAATLAEQGHLDEAEAACQEALRHQPDLATAHYNLGNIHSDRGRLDEADVHFREAIRCKSDYAEAYYNLGIVRARQRRFDDALANYRTALGLWPDYAEAHFALADLLLLLGDFAHGWPEYEWRWRREGIDPRPFAVPRWDGTPLQGRTILLHAEQGQGDTIQFLRYASLVQQREGRVVVECQPSLQTLAATCPGIEVVVARGAPLPAFDVHAPLLSLPGVLGTSLQTIPAQIPYLAADPERAGRWREELRSERKYKVGVVWQGSSTYLKDRQRSVPLAQMAPLAEVPNVALFSLQFGEGSEQLADAGFPLIDLGRRAAPLENLAALLVNLDLLICVDTAPAHLAGALGVPVWLALPAPPDWRWLLDRSDSPWYPTVRLFRQPREGDWPSVFAAMALELQKKAL